mmetsp:Transcript_40076/g.62575  ORF Transcript_40076/g.62575 Transcript_40076/m.62575 type:complete len:494 (-) Transcript_40076:1165-2646(-)
MVSSLPGSMSSDDFLGPIQPQEGEHAGDSTPQPASSRAAGLQASAQRDPNSGIARHFLLPEAELRITPKAQEAGGSATSSSGNGSGSNNGSSSSSGAKHMAPQGWDGGPKPKGYTLLHDFSFFEVKQPAEEAQKAADEQKAAEIAAEKAKFEVDEDEDSNGLRAKFARFLQREAKKKQVSMGQISRLSEGQQDLVEQHRLSTEYAKLSTELTDIHQLLSETKQALVVDKQLRHSARSSATRASAEEYLRFQKCQFERTNLSVSPPPMHHRARGQPKKESLTTRRRFSPHGGVPVRSSPRRVVTGRTPRHMPLASKGCATLIAKQACREAQHAAQVAQDAARKAAASAAEAASADLAVSRAMNAELRDRARAQQAKQMAVVVDAACERFQRSLAAPVVGPIDRALGRLVRWIHGSDAVHAQGSTQAAAPHDAPSERPGLLTMCCSNAAAEECLKEPMAPAIAAAFIPERDVTKDTPTRDSEYVVIDTVTAVVTV